MLEANADHPTLRVSMWGALAVTLLSLILGYVGYRALDLSPWDALFGTIQMFALDAPLDLPADSVALGIARFTAPLALVMATVVAVAAVLGQTVRHAARLRRVKQHIVILGLSDKSAELATALLEGGQAVVVVDIEGRHSGLGTLRRSGALVVMGDASRDHTQRLARVERSRRVVVSTGDDGRNLRTAETAVGLLEQSHNTTVHVLLDDYRLHEELARIEFMTSSTSGPTLDFVHRADREAATFIEWLTTHSPAAFDAAVVRFEGDGERGRRSLIHLVRRNLLLGVEIPIVVDQATQRAVVDPISRSSPWLAEAVRQLEVTDVMPGVCLVASSDTDGAVLGHGLRLAHAHPTADVFVMTDHPVGESLVHSSDRVHVVPAGSAAISPASFFSHSWVETLARARHQIYCALEVQRGTDPATNPSIASWDDLPEALKESNRDFARSISEVLADLPLRLVPLKGLPRAAPKLLEDRMEDLAREEHDRWARDLARMGWRWGPAPKDPKNLTHPLLVDWSDLAESEREKDRDSVRSIPTMLALVGLELRTG